MTVDYGTSPVRWTHRLTEAFRGSSVWGESPFLVFREASSPFSGAPSSFATCAVHRRGVAVVVWCVALNWKRGPRNRPAGAAFEPGPLRGNINYAGTARGRCGPYTRCNTECASCLTLYERPHAFSEFSCRRIRFVLVSEMTYRPS